MSEPTPQPAIRLKTLLRVSPRGHPRCDNHCNYHVWPALLQQNLVASRPYYFGG
ncbi:hypothetical protein BT96DRAFT_927221 [Gymnopus androsaceus JB14]|uniref:Uncharacterized protein n=1 Tax=Gymnopus androsaceus JB14 TaxID=1447944 RepID=A0A6A4GRA8_9AGAR|nr:hypothetical protein BT96DRAFT_927221 [Gymnopus androsaceus JB14]